jgi:DNA gyrase/topoisomerase IV subunit B
VELIIKKGKRKERERKGKERGKEGEKRKGKQRIEKRRGRFKDAESQQTLVILLFLT